MNKIDIDNFSLKVAYQYHKNMSIREGQSIRSQIYHTRMWWQTLKEIAKRGVKL
tara:strand:+ start:2107 stop:2268 length:162 start_codon:yes stop_codon:yes gene_type:complete